MAALFLSAPATLTAGGVVYALTPPTSLGRIVSGPRWSRDSQWLVFESRDDRGTHAQMRREIARTGTWINDAGILVRWSVVSGEREIIHRLPKNAYLSSLTFVGPRGEVAFIVSEPRGNQQVRSVYFSATGRTGTLVGQPFVASKATLTSNDTSKFTLLTYVNEGKLGALRIGAGGAEPVRGLEGLTAGDVSGLSEKGDVVLAASKGTEGAGLFRIDLDAGFATKDDKAVPARGDTPTTRPRFTLSASKVTRVPVAGESNAFEYSVTLQDQRGGNLRLAYATDSTVLVSPDGLKFLYATGEGFFIRELVPKAP